MSCDIRVIKKKAEDLLCNAPCDKYDRITRIGILQYHTSCTSESDTVPDLVQVALHSHILAIQLPFTRLKEPIVVFCPDTINNVLTTSSLDLRASLRLKLGVVIEYYEDLVTWYLSI